jgi:hypothetical protein
MTDVAAVPFAEGCHYWPAIGTRLADYTRHTELLRAVQATAQLVGWEVEEERHSGAWEWHQDPCCDMGAAGYATPEWEGEPGIIPVDRFVDDGDETPDTVILTLELTGNPELDALRVVLKVINFFTRGY